MKSVRAIAASLLGLALLAGWAGLMLLALDARYPLGSAPAPDTGVQAVDRNGKLLRAYAVADGRWRLPVALNDVDTDFVKMLVAYEDARFFSHPGVDPLAVLRAAGQVVANGEIVSGASTITMQLARLMAPRGQRTVSAKFAETFRALQLERRFNKDEILARYLTLAPYGGNIEGVRAASLAWFGKEPRRLTVAESALLIALPQAPEARRPDRDAKAAKAARDRVINRLAKAGLISNADAARARSAPVPTIRRDFPMFAAHAADEARRARPGATEPVRLTIDKGLQAQLETLARARAEGLGAKLSVAILVANHHSGEILARVGSADFFDAARAGQIDMSRAVRSPGSTLKPLIYGLAFDAGLVRPATLIEDRPVNFDGYRPENFELIHQGTVTVEEALQLSLNVPAVMLLDALGPARLMAHLKRAGLTPRLPRAEPPGLAIALGGVGLTLHDLVALYAAIARGGEAIALADLPEQVARASGPRVLGTAASWTVADILSGVPPALHATGGPIAYKTGTSYGYRDSWAVGFDGRHVIGVWVGRADATPVPDLTGRGGAAPILFEAFARISRDRVALAPAPAGAVRQATGDLPVPLQHFVPPSRFADASGAPAPAIAYPPDGARVALGLDARRASPLAVKVDGGTAPFRWLANGAPISADSHRRQLDWQPTGKGFSTLTVIDAAGRSDRVSVYLD